MNSIQLLNEDCLEVLRDLPDQSIDFMLLDEPFNSTSHAWDKEVLPQAELWEEKIRVIKPTGVIAHFAVGIYAAKLIYYNLKGYKFPWFWEKEQGGNFAVAKHQPLSVIEQILIFTGHGEKCFYSPILTKGKMRMKGGKNSAKNGSGFGGIKNIAYMSDTYLPRNVLRFPGVPRKKRLHPSEKPVDLLKYLIETHCPIGGTILDYTMGSGSTVVAAIETRRHCIGVENDKDIFNTACNRIQAVQSKTT